MKILLFAINGSFSHTSLAIRCLRPPLEAAGFTVSLLEKNLRDRPLLLLQDLLREEADIIGFSCYIWNLELMLGLAQDLKKLRPQCRVVFGGPEVSFETERFAGVTCIDAIICGEGEEALPRLCAQFRDSLPFSRIIHAAPSHEVMRDEGILYRSEESLESGAIIYYESSRGCPYSCAYCLSSATDGLRYKSVEQTLTDLQAFEALSDSIRVIKFVDRTFNAPTKRANAIWRALASPEFTRHYHFEVCANLLNEESFEVLSALPSGKIQLEFGLQSTYAPTLEAVSRHVDPQQVLTSVRRIHDMGTIHVHLDLIAGLPYESFERFGQSFDEAYFCCDQLQLGFLKLLPGTLLRARADEYGIAYESRPPYTVLQTKWISYEELMRLSDIADLLERYHNSGHFDRTLRHLLENEDLAIRPFVFYEGLSAFLARADGRRIRMLSQNDAYRLLYDYGCTLIAESSGDPVRKDSLQTALMNAMHEDYSESQVQRPPHFLRS